MLTLKKLNHVTYLTNNLPATIEFYTEVLGMKLGAAERRPVKTSDLQTAPSTRLEQADEGAYTEQLTVMFEMLDGSRIAFVEVAGLTNWPSSPLPRWIKHLAMRVNSEQDLHGAKAALNAIGIDTLGPTDHGLFLSVYFFDPINDIRLEYTWNRSELDEEDSRVAWEALRVWQAGDVPANRSFR